MVLQTALSVLIGYALGNFSPAFLLGKTKGYDVREEGSKNVGATNVFILLGKNAFFLTALLDILKAFADSDSRIVIESIGEMVSADDDNRIIRDSLLLQQTNEFSHGVFQFQVAGAIAAHQFTVRKVFDL